MQILKSLSDVDTFLLSLAGLVVAGIASEYLFKKTNIPDALWMVGIGLFMGPITGFVNDRWLNWVLPFFAPFALIVILFDGGSQISLRSLKSTIGRSSFLAIMTFTLSSLAIAGSSWLGVYFGYFTDWNWIKALMLGTILGGSSSIIIMPTMNLAKVDEKTSNLASIESAITDSFCVVATMVLIGLALKWGSQTSVNFAAIGADLIKVLGFGFIYGALGGLFWLFILPFLRGQYSYAITLSAIVALYVYVNGSGGSAALAILVFSIIVGNGSILGRFLKLEGERKISSDVDFLHKQLSFVVKVFFFTLVGLMLRPPWGPVAFGFVTLTAIILARYPGTLFVLRNTEYTDANKSLISACVPRGLAAGVLATLPFQYKIAGTEHLRSIVFSTVVLSIIYYSIRFALIRRKEKTESPTDLQQPQDAKELPLPSLARPARRPNL